MTFNCNTRHCFKNVKGWEKYRVTLKIKKLRKVDAVTSEQIRIKFRWASQKH